MFEKMMKILKKWFGKESVSVVENVLLETQVKNETRTRKSTLLDDLETYLFARYDFRFNVLTEQTEYRRKDEAQGEYRPVTQRVYRTWLTDLQREGMEFWKIDGLRTAIESMHIADYHPVKHFFSTLPEWDGVDRIGPLMRRLTRDEVMVGYLKDEERTKSVITMINGKRYYRTGDKGYLDEDGFLTIVDRYSRFAKLGGEMVSLGAVEKKIQDTPVLEGCDYVVTSIPDSAKGEKIVLLYQGDKDPKDVLSELRASGFPPIMLPAVAYAVEKVPKLGTGKADFTTAKKLAKELAGK